MSFSILLVMHRHLTSLISPVLRRWEPIMFWPVLITCFRALLILCQNENVNWMNVFCKCKGSPFYQFSDRQLHQMRSYKSFSFTRSCQMWDKLDSLWTPQARSRYSQSRNDPWMIDVHTTCHRSIQTLLWHFRLGRVGQMNPKTNGLTSQNQQPHHSVPKKRGKISCGLLVWFPCGES